MSVEKPGCASKLDVLELATIRYKKLTPGEKLVQYPFSDPVRNGATFRLIYT